MIIALNCMKKICLAFKLFTSQNIAVNHMLCV